MEELDRRRRLEQILRGLPVRTEAMHRVEEFAIELSESFLSARHTASRRRKTRTGDAYSELSHIATRADSLSKRLKGAHANTFQAWATAASTEDLDIQQATQEWLQLKRLLEDAAERARAAMTSTARASSPGDRGRPKDEVAFDVAIAAADAYQELTGQPADRKIDWDTGKPHGGFHDLLTVAFKALDINSSPDAANMRLQAELTRLKDRDDN